MNYEKQAHDAMNDAARIAGLTEQQIERGELYFGGLDGKTLMYNATSIYPPQEWLDKAVIAWRRYQSS